MRAYLYHVIASPEDPLTLVKPTEALRNTIQTLATAHALVLLDDDEIVGDPMEKATLEALEWKLGKGMSRK